MKDNNRENLIYIGIIVLLVVILTIRVTSQGRSIGESINSMQEEGIEFSSNEQEVEEKKEEIIFDEEFNSPNGKFSFEYPSEWQEIENDDILQLFQNPEQGDIDQYIQEETIREEEFEDIDLNEENIKQEGEIIGEILFMGMKTTFPNLSFGVMSVQRLDEKIENTEELEEIMSNEFEFENENEKAEIISSERGSDFIIMEVVTSTQGRSVFRSKNAAFLIDGSVYIISVNAPYESWGDFENEFNMIISSIEIND